MKQSPVFSRMDRIDPIQSRTHLNDFTSSPTKSQLDLRKIQALHQLYCELCCRSYQLHLFRNHIQQHLRTPAQKILTLDQIYRHGLPSQDNLGREAVDHQPIENQEIGRPNSESIICVLDSNSNIAVPQDSREEKDPRGSGYCSNSEAIKAGGGTARLVSTQTNQAWHHRSCSGTVNPPPGQFDEGASKRADPSSRLWLNLNAIKKSQALYLSENK